MNRWLVFDVGCIECGQDSEPVGLYATQEEADRVAKDYCAGPRWGRPEWTGEHHVLVFDLFDLESPGEVASGG